MPRLAWLAVGALPVWGCAYGLTAEKFTPAQRPQGVVAEVTLASQTLVSEILEVGENGLVVLTSEAVMHEAGGDAHLRETKVWILPYSAIRRAEFRQVRVKVSKGKPPRPAERETLRLVSRFPQGLRPELLQELLAACGQTEPSRAAP